MITVACDTQALLRRGESHDQSHMITNATQTHLHIESRLTIKGLLLLYTSSVLMLLFPLFNLLDHLLLSGGNRTFLTSEKL